VFSSFFSEKLPLCEYFSSQVYIWLNFYLYRKFLYVLFKGILQASTNPIYILFYIAVIIFHNQHESNPISMVFYIAVIIYDSVIISLTYCFFNISLDALCYRHM
jgi:threonine/homoserine/homoserine lactone efflux protein